MCLEVMRDETSVGRIVEKPYLIKNYVSNFQSHFHANLLENCMNLSLLPTAIVKIEGETELSNFGGATSLVKGKKKLRIYKPDKFGMIYDTLDYYSSVTSSSTKSGCLYTGL